jgi:hypothetical protein
MPRETYTEKARRIQREFRAELDASRRRMWLRARKDRARERPAALVAGTRGVGALRYLLKVYDRCYREVGDKNVCVRVARNSLATRRGK